MKKVTLLLGAAAAIALAAPVSAKAQTCTWWNLACNGLAPAVVDNGWHMAGRDANGNTVYFRRRVDSNGNVIFEQARRNEFGRYLVMNNHTVRRGSVYDRKKPKAIKYDNDVKGAKPHNVDYHAVKVEGAKVHGAKVHEGKDHEGKDHEGKAKGPKH